MVDQTRVSEWSVISSKHSQFQRDNEELINCEEATIDNQIIANPNEHVRNVTHLFLGALGEERPRADNPNDYLNVFLFGDAGHHSEQGWLRA